MSLTLKESCVMYERYCRRHSDTPTFEQFNQEHYTCLPSNKAAYDDFKRILVSARRSTGIPVTRRLPSLWSRFTGEKPSAVSVSGIPAVQVRTAEKSVRSSVPKYENALRNNVRLPKLAASPSSEQWSLEEYKEAVGASKSVLLKEPKNLIVHLVPDDKKMSLESLACKLTKSTWQSLRGKSDAPLKMRDGSTIEMSSISLDECDLAEFVTNRKKKIEGPYFVRFSRI